MIENEFFIEILKQTPTNSFVKTSGFLDYESAEKLRLIKFKDFKPASVGLSFFLTSNNIGIWIDYFKSIDISNVLTHYWIYHNDKLIANGFDSFEINIFDKDYYNANFDNNNGFELQFSNNLSTGFSEPKRLITLINTKEYNGNYSLDIGTKINNKDLILKFSIDKQDFNNLTELINETSLNYKLRFLGSYSSQLDNAQCGLILVNNSLEIDLMINVSKKLLSNLLWFQEINNIKEIEQMII